MHDGFLQARVQEDDLGLKRVADGHRATAQYRKRCCRCDGESLHVARDLPERCVQDVGTDMNALIR